MRLCTSQSRFFLHTVNNITVLLIVSVCAHGEYNYRLYHVNFDIVLVVVMLWLQVEMDDDAEANNAADVLVQSDINTDGVLVMQEVKIVLFVLYNMCLLYAHSSHYELHIQTHTHTRLTALFLGLPR